MQRATQRKLLAVGFWTASGVGGWALWKFTPWGGIFIAATLGIGPLILIPLVIYFGLRIWAVPRTPR